ncbi:hypothetical protein M8J77_023783 [Diaphorina citri]|nr:hypothetical protein M8J77_023783 [Diaphorina citri]
MVAPTSRLLRGIIAHMSSPSSEQHQRQQQQQQQQLQFWATANQNMLANLRLPVPPGAFFSQETKAYTKYEERKLTFIVPALINEYCNEFLQEENKTIYKRKIKESLLYLNS